MGGVPVARNLLDMKICSECLFPLDKTEDFYRKKATCKFCLRKDLPKGRPPALARERAEQAVRLYRSGLSLAEVGKQMGVGFSSVRRLMLRAGAQLRTDTQHQKTATNPFEVIDTEEKAYWLGFLATDGNVYGSRIQLNLSHKDDDHLRKWCRFMGLNPETDIKVRPKKGTKYVIHSVAFRSKAVAHSLASLGITPKKSFTVKPWCGPEHLMRHYWRGCIDGDGWICSPQVGFCGNLEMVEGFAALCAGKTLPHRSIFRCVVYGAKRNWLLHYLYSGASVFLERKLRAAECAVPAVQLPLGSSAAAEGAVDPAP